VTTRAHAFGSQTEGRRQKDRSKCHHTDRQTGRQNDKKRHKTQTQIHNDSKINRKTT
jgi:hypothetical protein